MAPGWTSPPASGALSSSPNHNHPHSLSQTYHQLSPSPVFDDPGAWPSPPPHPRPPSSASSSTSAAAAAAGPVTSPTSHLPPSTTSLASPPPSATLVRRKPLPQDAVILSRQSRPPSSPLLPSYPLGDSPADPLSLPVSSSPLAAGHHNLAYSPASTYSFSGSVYEVDGQEDDDSLHSVPRNLDRYDSRCPLPVLSSPHLLPLLPLTLVLAVLAISRYFCSRETAFPCPLFPSDVARLISDFFYSSPDLPVVVSPRPIYV